MNELNVKFKIKTTYTEREFRGVMTKLIEHAMLTYEDGVIEGFPIIVVSKR